MIQIHPAYIAKINKNQMVTLRFQGLAPSKYGEGKALVQLVPADTIVLNNTSIFLVDAILEKPYLVSQKDEKVFLHIGMTAEARIIVDSDTVIKTLLRKLDFIF